MKGKCLSIPFVNPLRLKPEIRHLDRGRNRPRERLISRKTPKRKPPLFVPPPPNQKLKLEYATGVLWSVPFLVSLVK